jgi:hypothetical protein
MSSRRGTELFCQCLIGDPLDVYIERTFEAPKRIPNKDDARMKKAIASIVVDDPAMSEKKITEFCDVADEVIESGDLGKLGKTESNLLNGMGANARTKRVLRFHYGVCQWRREVRATDISAADTNYEFLAMPLHQHGIRSGCRYRPIENRP